MTTYFDMHKWLTRVHNCWLVACKLSSCVALDLRCTCNAVEAHGKGVRMFHKELEWVFRLQCEGELPHVIHPRRAGQWLQQLCA